MDDDPCWGGPEASKHDLQYLLQQINEENTVIHECSSYIAINKPPDLRMDGPYSATVHKLISYWYPSKSLLKQIVPPSSSLSALTHDNNDKNNEKDDNKQKNKEKDNILFKILSSMSKFNHIKDNELRPCHQLDYATSGILLIARTKEAAHKACIAFESRTNMQKEYLAIVNGHIDTSKIQTLLDDDNDNSFFDVNNYLKGIEDKYKLCKRKRKQYSFVGYMPNHAIFEKWKSWIKKRETKSESKSNKTSYNNDDQYLDDIVFNKLNQKLSKLDKDELVTLAWSILNKNKNKKYGHCKELFINTTNEWNKLKKEKLQEEEHQQQQQDFHKESDIPFIFRTNKDDSNSFYINAPIAIIPDSFYMMMHPSILENIPNSNYYQEKLGSSLLSSSNDINSLDYKPAITLCKIISKGIMYNNKGKEIKITKILLRPLTGRRHQLRLHMVACGNAILGDSSYEFKDKEEAEGERRDSDIDRMCLHAYRLNFVDDEEKKERKFIAPDPFLMKDNDNGDSILTSLKIQ